MRTLSKIIMIFAVAAFIGIAGAQNATPNLPVGLQGSVSIGGNPAPQGTAIYAKVGDTVVGQTEVQTAGVYGDTASDLLPVAPPKDGTTVDIYVNDVKVTTFTYHESDAQAGKTFEVDLNAPASAATPTPTPIVGTLSLINIIPANVALAIGQIQVFNAVDRNGNAVLVNWSNSNTTVGTLNSTTGSSVTFTATALGTTTITAANGSVSNTSQVTVTAQYGNNGTIAGNVTNATSGAPLNATITAGGITAATVNGSYNISIAPGTYSVTAGANGYQSNTTAGVVVTSGNVATVNFALTPPPANGTIAGNVTNATSGAPLSATITAGGITAATINGSYNISIAPGTYSVTAGANGYQSNTTAGVVVTSGNVTTVNLALTPTPAPTPTPALVFAAGGGGGATESGNGGRITRGTATPTVTATSTPKELLSTAGTTPITTVSPPVAPTQVTFNFSSILGVVAALALCGIIVVMRKKGRL